ncbi:accessory Sec-dependent serine-rich glycoprotein adhesin, partial [Ligilactobacillus salivarius]|uniref:accessory Sec-dependent serine-rich glycoprotein adhesin n=1 Tax=Ligilactobacillus salivarius TaxID=1624 RepID=UPI003F232593
MKFRRNKKDFFEFENDRKTHVKLYKAGKQWVSSLISSIGLIRVFKGKLDKSTMNTQLVSKEKDKKSEDKLSSDGIAAALKGVAALGAVAGGTVLTANTALADTKQLDSNQNLVNKDTVNLSSGSGSSSTSESSTQSAASVSKSESVSLDTNSSSTSETRSDSNSKSESISESKSDSNSQSVSSQTTSKSESLVSTSLENSQTTTGTTAKDKLQGLINQATDFVNSDAFKSSSSDLKAALAATVKQYATVMQSSTSLTEQDYQYGIDNLALLMNEIKTPSSSIKHNIFMVNAQTNSSLGTPDGNTASGDTPAYWGVDTKNNNNKYKWIAGDNRLWWDVNAYTSRDKHQTIDVAKNNVEVKKEDLGGGKTKWTITFYPGHGVYYDGYKASDYGLVNAQMGFYLTKDYKIPDKIDGNYNYINIHTSIIKGTTYTYNKDYKYTVRTSAKDPTSGDVDPESDIKFMPGNVNQTNGVIGSTMNPYYQFGRYADISHMTPDNFKKSVFDGIPDGSDKNHESFASANELDNATARVVAIQDKQGSKDIVPNKVQDKQGSRDMVANKAPFTTSFNKDTIGTAMYLQSWGDSKGSMDASYTVTFTTLHSNATQAELAAGNYNGAFSGVYAIANTFQNNVDVYHAGWGRYPTLQGQLVGQEAYNLKIDDKSGTGTIDSTVPSKLTSESNSESESESKSSSESVSTSQSQSESKSVSTSQSESTSTSSSLSESLSTSSSLSESLSTSSSLSESLSTSSSLSESLSTS